MKIKGLLQKAMANSSNPNAINLDKRYFAELFKSYTNFCKNELEEMEYTSQPELDLVFINDFLNVFNELKTNVFSKNICYF